MKRALLIAALTFLAALQTHAQSAAISFQGQLGDGGAPATGNYDFIFRLFDAATDGSEKATAVAINNKEVSNGYFTVPLDFGIAAYSDGGRRFIQMEVRTAGTQDAFAVILPRTAMTPVPYALFALSGNAGPKGDKGDTGAMGPQGPQGIVGPQGLQGLQGIQGLKGDRGDVGPQGSKGDAGLVFRGPWNSVSSYVASDVVVHMGSAWVAKRSNNDVTPTQGDDWTMLASKGDAGPQGTAGIAGIQGPKGDTGAMGPQGPQGLQGIQGLKGDRGDVGPQGIMGPQPIAKTHIITASGGKLFVDGIQQESLTFLRGQRYVLDQSHSSNAGHPLRFSTTSDGTHLEGADYTDGWKYEGMPGTDGIATFVVPFNAPGTLFYYCVNHAGMGSVILIKDLSVADLRGPKGDTGDQGPQGVKGDTGAMGPQGPQGIVGPQGLQGLQGLKGDTGDMGPQGPQGLQGIAGAKGDAGLNFRGPWSSISNYVSSDAVFHEGTTWVAKRPNIAIAPIEGQDWAVLAAKGNTGDQGPQGVKGDTGAMGPQGPQGIVGPQGLQGVKGDTGPQGLQGIAGPQGAAGLNFRGPWSSTENYNRSDAVYHAGASWVAKRDNINVTPIAGEDWALLAAKGDTGPQGIQGLKGDRGDMGPQGVADAPTLANIPRLNLPSNSVTALAAPVVRNAAQATGTLTVTSGFITGVSIATPGQGYFSVPSVTITDSNGSGATVDATIGNGRVTGLTVTSAGSGYSNPTITVAPPDVSGGFIHAVDVTEQGRNYQTVPQVTVTDSTGSGAVLQATVVNGKVTGINVVNHGQNYTNPQIAIGAPPDLALQVFSSDNHFLGNNNVFKGRFEGDGSGLTNLTITAELLNSLATLEQQNSSLLRRLKMAEYVERANQHELATLAVLPRGVSLQTNSFFEDANNTFGGINETNGTPIHYVRAFDLSTVIFETGVITNLLEVGLRKREGQIDAIRPVLNVNEIRYSFGESIISDTYTVRSGDDVFVYCNGYHTNVSYQMNGLNSGCEVFFYYNDGEVATTGRIDSQTSWTGHTVINPFPSKIVKAIRYRGHGVSTRQIELRNFTVVDYSVAQPYSLIFDLDGTFDVLNHQALSLFIVLNIVGDGSVDCTISDQGLSIGPFALTDRSSQHPLLPGFNPQTIKLTFSDPTVGFSSLFVAGEHLE